MLPTTGERLEVFTARVNASGFLTQEFGAKFAYPWKEWFALGDFLLERSTFDEDKNIVKKGDFDISLHLMILKVKREVKTRGLTCRILKRDEYGKPSDSHIAVYCKRG